MSISELIQIFKVIIFYNSSMSILTFIKQFCFISIFSAGSMVALFAQHPCAKIRQTGTHRAPVARPAAISAMLNYDIEFYFLDVSVEKTSTYISGNVLHRARVVNGPISTYTFELHPNLTIDSIQVNSQSVTYTRNGNEVDATLLTPANTGSLLSVKIWYKGTPPNSGGGAIGDGFTNDVSPSWGNSVTWSLSQPYVAYEWWPCKQVLTDKADSSWVFITTDSVNLAGSNGLLTQIVPVGNKKRFEWKSSYPINYYLISVAVAEYIDYSFYANPIGSPNPVLIQNYIYNNPATLPNFQADIDETKDMIELLADLYGPYPFDKEKYGHCMAPLSGGMEHQTMTTQGFFDFTLTVHELGHQWFGDHVTCSTWSDIWMNEGFASYTEYLGLENLHPGQEVTHMLDVHQSVKSQPDGSVWFTDTANVSRIFDSRLTYDKGGAIIHTLRWEINDDSIFFLILQTWQQQYANSNGSALQFKQVAEQVSGKNLTAFFDEWFFGEGFPTYAIKWFYKNGMFYLQNNQSVSMQSITPLFTTPVEFKLSRQAAPDTFIRLSVSQLSQVYSFPVQQRVTGIVLEPNNWIINNSGGVTQDSSIMALASTAAVDIQLPLINFGPNPAQNYLQITIEEEGAGVLEVYDGMGKRMSQESLSEGVHQLNTQFWTPGVYHLRYSTNSGKVYFAKRWVL